MFHFDYELTQPRAHGAAEEPFPATKAVELWNWIFAQYPPDADRPDSPFNNLTGNILSMQTESDDVNESVLMKVALRLPPRIDPAEFENRLREHVENAAKITLHETLPAVKCKRSTPLAAAFNKAIRETGGLTGYSVKTGTSDMNIAEPVWQCPTLAYGPGDSSLDHTPNEHLMLSEFDQSIDVLERALLHLDTRLDK
jgi:LysW-gamma-L-lysine carboxypeptidase